MNGIIPFFLFNITVFFYFHCYNFIKTAKKKFNYINASTWDLRVSMAKIMLLEKECFHYDQYDFSLDIRGGLLPLCSKEYLC